MTKVKTDPLKKIKYVGYSMSQLSDDNVTMIDFVRYAKFFLCSKTHRLMKDPIWDGYTAEEILAEFYAYQFNDNEKFLKEFELELIGDNGELDSFDKWVNSNIAASDLERKKTLESLEERVSFNPTEFLGED